MPGDQVKYWLDLVEYDLETAEAMLATKRFLYVGFMCHQVVEKSLKAYYSLIKKEIPPYIHNLSKLAILTNLFEELTENQKEFLDRLEPLNIEGRYPAYKDEMLKMLTPERCKILVEETNKFKTWILQKLNK